MQSLSVEVRGKSTFGDSLTIITNFYSFEKPLQNAPQWEPQTAKSLWPENSYLVYCQWLSYIDQKTKKKFVRKGWNACLEELKEKHGVKTSGSTLDRIVLKGKEAKGGVVVVVVIVIVCLERKRHDRSQPATSHISQRRSPLASS